MRDPWVRAIQRGECSENIRYLVGNNVRGPLVIITPAQGKSHDVVSGGNAGQVSRGCPIVHSINEDACPKGG